MEAILAATCRLIAVGGVEHARTTSIAEAAGVSQGLVYYHFGTRKELLLAAFAFANARLGAFAVSGGPTRLKPLALLEQRVVNQIADADVVREAWVIWSELGAAAVFDEDLRRLATKLSAEWVAGIADLIRRAQLAGEVGGDVDVDDAAEHITAAVDSFGWKWLVGAMSVRRARALIRQTLSRELRVAGSSHAS